jgi:arginine-tRNA-protein transferase
MTFQKDADLRLAKFRMMEHGLIGSNYSAVAFDCGTCKACIPLRINIDRYAPTKALDANTRRNRDLTQTLDFTYAELSIRKHGPELYALFQTYMKNRHPASDMAEYSYEDFLVFALPQNHTLTLKDSNGKILAAAFLDIETNPSVYRSIHYYYAFYDPDAAHNPRSLGTALWLAGIKLAKERGFKHVYVGAGAVGSPKLAYKFSYPGLEAFANGAWEPYDPAKHTEGPDYSAWLRKNTLEL